MEIAFGIEGTKLTAQNIDSQICEPDAIADEGEIFAARVFGDFLSDRWIFFYRLQKLAIETSINYPVVLSGFVFSKA